MAGRGLLWIGILAALSIPIWMMLVFWWLASDPATPEPKHEPHTRPIPYVQPAPEPELKR